MPKMNQPKATKRFKNNMARNVDAPKAKHRNGSMVVAVKAGKRGTEHAHRRAQGGVVRSGLAGGIQYPKDSSCQGDPNHAYGQLVNPMHSHGMGLGFPGTGFGFAGGPGAYAPVPPGDYSVANTKDVKAPELIGEFIQKNNEFPRMPYLATIFCSVAKSFQCRYVTEMVGPNAGWIQYVVRAMDGSMKYTLGPPFQYEEDGWRDPQYIATAPASVDTMWGFHEGYCKFAPMAGPQGQPQSMLSNGMFPYELTNGMGMSGCPTGYQPHVNADGQYGCQSGTTFMDMPPGPSAQPDSLDNFVVHHLDTAQRKIAKDRVGERKDPRTLTYKIADGGVSVIYISAHVGSLTKAELERMIATAVGAFPATNFNTGLNVTQRLKDFERKLKHFDDRYQTGGAQPASHHRGGQRS
jgi:hypothetical protein